MSRQLHAIVPAGGSGTRLWPLSRAATPKFLLDVTAEGRTLIQQTWDRLEPIVGADRITVVTGAAHAEKVSAQLPGLRQLIAEPSPRDSMPAIGLAAAVIAQRDPQAIVGSFAADQQVRGDEAFADAVRQATAVAADGLICTIGIPPTEASTAYGYIDGGDLLGVDGAQDARRVRRFVEKPDPATAQQYLAAGTYSWNAGIFVVGAQILLDHLARQQPTLHDGLRRIAASWDTPERQAVLTDTWPMLTKIAIDHAVAEPVSLDGGLAVVPGRFGWSDIGDFTAIDGTRANSTWIDADGSIFGASDVHVAVVGLHDIVVVRTEDAILVTDRAHAQQVKQVPAALRDQDRDDLI